MIDKRVASLAEAVAGIKDGSTLLVGGFGAAGAPTELIHAVLDQGAKDLVVVSNNAGVGTEGLAALMAARRVRRIICSYPRSGGSVVFDELYAKGEIELELLPQGTISERLRGDVALINAHKADRWGNLLYRLSSRNFAPDMAMAADLTIVQAEGFVELGDFDPDNIHTPGIFVDRVVHVEKKA